MYWQQRASGEVATFFGTNGAIAINEVGNVGKTLRNGWDAQLNLQPDEQWRVWLGYSRQKAEIAIPDPSAPATRGKQIENVPRWLTNVGAEWQVLPKLKFSAWGMVRETIMLSALTHWGVMAVIFLAILVPLGCFRTRVN